MTKSEIPAEIRRTAEANGVVPLGKMRFFSATTIKESDWAGIRRVTWSDALEEAGYEPNKKNKAYDRSWVMARLPSYVRELGHYPVRNELRIRRRNDDDFPSNGVFERIGRKRDVVSMLRDWCEANPGWEDVAEFAARVSTS